MLLANGKIRDIQIARGRRRENYPEDNRLFKMILKVNSLTITLDNLKTESLSAILRVFDEMNIMVTDEREQPANSFSKSSQI